MMHTQEDINALKAAIKNTQPGFDAAYLQWRAIQEAVDVLKKTGKTPQNLLNEISDLKQAKLILFGHVLQEVTSLYMNNDDKFKDKIRPIFEMIEKYWNHEVDIR